MSGIYRALRPGAGSPPACAWIAGQCRGNTLLFPRLLTCAGQAISGC